ncbi:hypothetical protein AB0M43_07300 [Longispora sp. NPDC051575]|uniref:hypothetical protein n=1 Tax=Longispora sp. NPDC051575 TaxID=3154943 RepID=UPI0034203403
MTVADQFQADYESEVWARTILLGSRPPRPDQRVEAYRILAASNPRGYGARLARALVGLRYADGDRAPIEVQLGRLEDACAAVELADPQDPGHGRLVTDVLGTYQRLLYSAGRRAEGLAIRARIASTPGGDRVSYALGLAEEGRHAEASEVLTEVPDGTGQHDIAWNRFALTAQLDMAGRTAEAVAVLDEVLGEDLGRMSAGTGSVATVFHESVWRAALLDRAGRESDAGAARREAMALLRRLAATGEPKNWCGAQYSIAGTLLSAMTWDTGHHDPGEPRPPYGADLMHWSPDLRAHYGENSGLAACGCVDPDRPPRPVPDPAGQDAPLAEAAVAHRRRAIRIGTYHLWRRGHQFLETALPAFDDSVTAARRWHASDDRAARPALVRALTERAVLLAAGHQFQEGLSSYEEAVRLIG